MNRSLPFVVVFLLLALAAGAQSPPDDPAAKLPDGKDKATKQIPGFRVPPGFKVELFAAEPMLGSPVAIAVDEKNRVYVAEEYRFNAGTEENRTRAFLLEDDLQVRTLDDRLKMFKKHESKFDGGMSWFTKNADQLRLLEDTTGSGLANKSTVLAKFNEPLDGLFSGVLATNGDVYLTCIPELKVLRKGADKPETLLRGFGVNAAFLGHDLHGLCWGPDGKLYFSVGDRGYDVKSKEGRTFNQPRTGAVFRCNPDGTEFEVVHTGLRNPQELAFDQYGNLFADDNNCDKGDHARLVYVVEGGESGWNMAYQTIPPPYMCGPWFAERLWHLQHAGQPAYIVPPVGSIGAGPSGFLFTSGTALPDRYRNSFLMCNYTGNGGLESFKVKPVGAGFEIQDYHDFLKPIMATDAEFGYDGKLYVSDFVNLDWTGKSLGGRVYTVFDPKKIKEWQIEETKQLFANGFDVLSQSRLQELLEHPDQRVRLRAQHTLAQKGRLATSSFVSTISTSKKQHARLHAVWGLGQVARTEVLAAMPCASLMQNESDSEVLAQLAKVVGETLLARKSPLNGMEQKLHDRVGVQLRELLSHSHARVQFFAAQSLGKLQHSSAVDPLFALLKKNADTDAYLRHACVTALARIGDADAIAAKANDSSPAVRLAVVLIQRKLKDKRIVAALTDPDWFIRTEAARAIHDLPMEELYPDLAALLPKLGTQPIPDGDPLVRRCINAAYRLGTEDHARAVLSVVTNSNFSSAVREEALSAIAEWADPPPRDRVTGFWRPLPKRDAATIRPIVEENLAKLFEKCDGRLLTSTISMIQKLGVKADANQFVQWAKDTKKDANLRIASLQFLTSKHAAELPAILSETLNDASPRVRAESRELIAKSDPKRGLKLYEDVLNKSDAVLTEQQRALREVAKQKTPEAEKIIEEFAERLAKGNVPDGLKFEVLEAISNSPTPTRTKAKQAYEKTLPPGPIRNRPQTMYGGDAETGRDLFFNHTAAQCVRCHLVNGTGGTAGPELSKIASKYPENLREHLLESLLQPSAKIAEGYATVTMNLLDGRVVAGTILKEDVKSVSLKDTNGKLISVSVEDIESRTKPVSPMPSMEKTLRERDFRDLVEYLSTLK